MSDHDKPSHAFRWMLSEGATADEVQAHLQRRINKANRDYRELMADMVRELGVAETVRQAREWLARDRAGGGIWPEWLDAQERYIDSIEARGAALSPAGNGEPEEQP